MPSETRTGSQTFTAPLGETIPWNDLTNILAGDGSLASAYVQPEQCTDLIGIQDCGFSIPAGATNIGVTARIKWRASAESGLQTFVQLLYQGWGGDDKGGGLPPYGDAQWQEFGGPGDQWGWQLTPQAVNSPQFGVVFAVRGLTDAALIEVEQIELTVHWD